MRQLTLWMAVGGMLGAGMTLRASPALAQVNPFRQESAQRLSDADFKALSEAASALLARPDLKAGDKQSWANPKTGSSGTIIAEGTFQHGSFACRRLRYVTLGRGQPPARTAVLGWCDTPQGWKIASP
ncbi:MAG: hypothetical protein KGL12_06360 [Rhodospirillales bacterium]|nr:hypothetical protein [Rhodospirillales bacterium]